MSFLGKTYTVVKQENLEGFLKSVGLDDERIEKITKLVLTLKLEKNGDSYTATTTGFGEPKVVSFKSGVEFDDTMGPEKTQVKTTYTVDGNTVTQVTTSASSSSTATFKREYNGDEMVVTITTNKWDGVAKVFYKA